MSQDIVTDERRRPGPKFARRFAVTVTSSLVVVACLRAVTSSLVVVACLRVALGYATALRSSPSSL